MAERCLSCQRLAQDCKCPKGPWVGKPMTQQDDQARSDERVQMYRRQLDGTPRPGDEVCSLGSIARDLLSQLDAAKAREAILRDRFGLTRENSEELEAENEQLKAELADAKVVAADLRRGHPVSGDET